MNPFAELGLKAHHELPILTWDEDDFFMPTSYRRRVPMHGPEFEQNVSTLNKTFEEEYRNLRKSYESRLKEIWDKHLEGK